VSAKKGTKLSDVLICSSMALSFHFWFFNPGLIPLMLRRKKEGGVTCSCLDDDGEVGGGFVIVGGFVLEVCGLVSVMCFVFGGHRFVTVTVCCLVLEVDDNMMFVLRVHRGFGGILGITLVVAVDDVCVFGAGTCSGTGSRLTVHLSGPQELFPVDLLLLPPGTEKTAVVRHIYFQMTLFCALVRICFLLQK